MKGYKNVKEYINDLNLLDASIKLFSDENVSVHLKKEIQKKYLNGSKTFKNELKKKGYTKNDFLLITAYNNIESLENITCFLKQIKTYQNTAQKIKTILKSAAFRNGNLKAINHFLPKKLNSKDELVCFIQNSSGINLSIIKIICEFYKLKKWKQYLHEAEKEDLITHYGREWC